MAERRMFSRNLVQTDRFLDLAPIAQALYFQLCLAADDDGFLSNVKSMARMVGAAPKDLTDLEAGGYLICFPSGVAVIRHWLVHNSIRKDRYTPTLHQEERAMLTLGQDGCWERKPEEAHAAEGGEEAGTEETPGEGSPEAPGCQPGSRTAAQDGPGQVRTGERARKGEHEPGCQPGNQTEAGATRQAGEPGANRPLSPSIFIMSSA